jgi:hypothetical protein
MHDIEEKVGGWMDGYVESFSSLDASSPHRCNFGSFIFALNHWVIYPRTYVHQKIICIRSSPKKEKKLLIFPKVVENRTLIPTIGFSLQIHNTSCVLCIHIPSIVENEI